MRCSAMARLTARGRAGHDTVMAGAALTHLVHGEPQRLPVPLVYLLVTALVDGAPAQIRTSSARPRPNNAPWYNGRALAWLLILAAYTLLACCSRARSGSTTPTPAIRSRGGGRRRWRWPTGTCGPSSPRSSSGSRGGSASIAGTGRVRCRFTFPSVSIFTVAKQLADTFSASAITGITRGPTTFMKVHVSFLTYWAIVGITYTFEHYQRYRERELQAAHLETALARAEVQSLQMQIQPHFLFNTLNAIAALMREDVEAADVMIARLSDLLRETLATAEVPEVPLRRELELADMYLDIQRARLGDRLTTHVSAEPQTLDVQVPTLLLQPLVENAIRHGAAALYHCSFAIAALAASATETWAPKFDFRSSFSREMRRGNASFA